MSWFKSAVHKAVEASGRNPLGRTVKSYAGTVAHHAGQAVGGGAKILQDRIGTRYYKNLNYTSPSLEEVVVSCRGEERIELLRQLLVSLRGTERISGSSDEAKTLEQALAFEPRKAPLILDAPNEEEVLLLLEIFGLCLTGDKKDHKAIMSNIQQLANTLSSYHDEVLVKREELLQFAQTAISGVKLNADLTRIDAEATSLWKRIDGMEVLGSSSIKDHTQESVKVDFSVVEGMKEALAEVQLCSKLEELLIKKRSIKNGDSAEIHSEKVHKLKVLAESLANSSSKAEMRISDHRHQLEEALNFRVAKTNEVNETEKGLSAEIAGLERQRDRLEAELMKVNISLKAALVRLNKHREERNHFDEASNQIILHLKLKENELSRSILSFKVEADTVHAWIKFLDDTWVLQASYTELKEKLTNDELEKNGNCFLRLVKHHLLACREELRPSINHIRELVNNLKSFIKRSEKMLTVDTGASSNSKSQISLKKEYLESEGKVVTALGVVDHMKELFYTAQAHPPRRDDPEIKELFDVIDRMKWEFGSIERPMLEVEAPKEKASGEKSMKKNSSFAARATNSPRPKRTESQPGTPSAHQLYQGSELSEFVDASGEWPNDNILGWELD